jgi:hypothetical protein
VGLLAIHVPLGLDLSEPLQQEPGVTDRVIPPRAARFGPRTDRVYLGGLTIFGAHSPPPVAALGMGEVAAWSRAARALLKKE